MRIYVRATTSKEETTWKRILILVLGGLFTNNKARGAIYEIQTHSVDINIPHMSSAVPGCCIITIMRHSSQFSLFRTVALWKKPKYVQYFARKEVDGGWNYLQGLQ